MPESKTGEPVFFRPSLRSELSSLVIVLILAALAYGTYRWHPEFDFLDRLLGAWRPDIVVFAYFAFLAGAILQMAVLLYHTVGTSYSITGDQVEECHGIIAQHINRVDTEHIRYVHLDQSMLGRILDYGDVGLSTLGGNHHGFDITLAGNIRPNQVRNQLQAAAREAEDRRVSRPLQPIVEKLGRIECLLEDLNKGKREGRPSGVPGESERGQRRRERFGGRGVLIQFMTDACCPYLI